MLRGPLAEDRKEINDKRVVVKLARRLALLGNQLMPAIERFDFFVRPQVVLDATERNEVAAAFAKPRLGIATRYFRTLRNTTRRVTGRKVRESRRQLLAGGGSFCANCAKNCAKAGLELSQAAWLAGRNVLRRTS